jgi:death-on-curing protein
MLLTCLRCGHKWDQRGEEAPKVCPSCKSPWWNIQPKLTKEFIEAFKASVIRLHEQIIKESGGLEGIRDDGGIYHATDRILTQYGKSNCDPFQMAANVLEYLAKRHFFNDGNKRTAYCWAKIILFTHNIHLKIKYKEAAIFIKEVATFESNIPLHQIYKWLKENSIEIDAKKTEDLENYLKDIYFDVTNKDFLMEKKNEE